MRDAAEERGRGEKFLRTAGRAGFVVFFFGAALALARRGYEGVQVVPFAGRLRRTGEGAGARGAFARCAVDGVAGFAGGAGGAFARSAGGEHVEDSEDVAVALGRWAEGAADEGWCGLFFFYGGEDWLLIDWFDGLWVSSAWCCGRCVGSSFSQGMVWDVSSS